MRKPEGCQTPAKYTTDENRAAGNLPKSTALVMESCAKKNETKIAV